jgi:hypothetical protein
MKLMATKYPDSTEDEIRSINTQFTLTTWLSLHKQVIIEYYSQNEIKVYPRYMLH